MGNWNSCQREYKKHAHEVTLNFNLPYPYKEIKKRVEIFQSTFTDEISIYQTDSISIYHNPKFLGKIHTMIC